ncbi:unnamed protein product [Cuscuta campestris]|uniref:Uncharacterized protein n=1 Tax=Cuscuta campestris TaxID=132261 RepID=A0A484LQW3_9ASTE|nr:unnamed protein product [Cuscuta campestris]
MFEKLGLWDEGRQGDDSVVEAKINETKDLNIKMQKKYGFFLAQLNKTAYSIQSGKGNFSGKGETDSKSVSKLLLGVDISHYESELNASNCGIDAASLHILSGLSSDAVYAINKAHDTILEPRVHEKQNMSLNNFTGGKTSAEKNKCSGYQSGGGLIRPTTMFNLAATAPCKGASDLKEVAGKHMKSLRNENTSRSDTASSPSICTPSAIYKQLLANSSMCLQPAAADSGDREVVLPSNSSHVNTKGATFVDSGQSPRPTTSKRLTNQFKPYGVLNVQALPFQPAFKGLRHTNVGQSNQTSEAELIKDTEEGIQTQKRGERGELHENRAAALAAAIYARRRKSAAAPPASGWEETQCSEMGKAEDSDPLPEDDIHEHTYLE